METGLEDVMILITDKKISAVPDLRRRSRRPSSRAG
jgi:hypothetical protein